MVFKEKNQTNFKCTYLLIISTTRKKHKPLDYRFGRRQLYT